MLINYTHDRKSPPSVSRPNDTRAYKTLRIVILAVFLPSTCLYSNKYWASDCPIGMVLSPILIGGIVGLLLSLSVAIRSIRPLGVGDIVRIICWGMVGLYLGRHIIGSGYYDYYYPQYGPVVDVLMTGVLIVALSGIAVSFFLFPQASQPEQGCCQSCGYNLQGLKECRCPECGTIFDTASTMPIESKDKSDQQTR